jgi:hypothetical protein
MTEKHVAVCDNCGKEGELQDPDKLQRFPNRPPTHWFVAGEVNTMYNGYHAHLCSLKCLSEWAADPEKHPTPLAVAP